jgi:tetrapyrrole methylase family protein/MazG family protein
MNDAKQQPACTDPMLRLRDVIARLRGEDGCPWDREQTLDSLRPLLLEETYELVEAIEDGDVDGHKEELGDVLLHILLQCRIREEEGLFTVDDVAAALAEKLIRRHPHVFADVRVDGSREVMQNWEAIKAEEKKERTSVVDGIPRGLPGLQKAHRIQTRAARVGFDWSDVEDVVGKVEEELAETREALASGDTNQVKAEIGDLLFAVVNLSRFQNINAEDALETTIKKFVRRFREVERRFHEAGRSLDQCTLDEMDAVWESVKADE